MKKNIIIFGTGKIAEVITYYAMQQTQFNIVAFVVDENYKTTDIFMGKPVITTSSVLDLYPPDKFDAFIAIGYHELNKVRQEKFEFMKKQGYNLVSIVDTNPIPSNVKIGENCFVMSPNIIHPFVELGNNVFVWSGAMIGHHSKVSSHCWLTSSCNVSGNVEIGENTFLAVNATVGHSIKIGARCFLGANSLVTKSLEDDKVVIAESDKPMKITSTQFLKYSKFSSL